MDMKDETTSIVVKIVTQDGGKLTCQMNRDSQLIKLLLFFCKRKQVSYRSMRFLYLGKRIQPKLSPNLLNMEDGAQIDAMTDQDGGAPFSSCYC